MGCAASTVKAMSPRARRARRINEHRERTLAKARGQYMADQVLDDARVAFSVGMLAELPTAFLLWAADGAVLHANSAALELLDHNEETLRVGNHVSKLLELPPRGSPRRDADDFSWLSYQHMVLNGILAGGGRVPLRFYATAVDAGDGVGEFFCGTLIPAAAGPGAPAVTLTTATLPTPAGPQGAPGGDSPGSQHSNKGHAALAQHASWKSACSVEVPGGQSATGDGAQAVQQRGNTGPGSSPQNESPAIHKLDSAPLSLQIQKLNTDGAVLVAQHSGSLSHPVITPIDPQLSPSRELTTGTDASRDKVVLVSCLSGHNITDVTGTGGPATPGSFGKAGSFGKSASAASFESKSSHASISSSSRRNFSPRSSHHLAASPGAGSRRSIKRVSFTRSALPNEVATLLDAPQHPCMLLTQSGLVMHWNVACERMFGPTADEMLGHSVSNLVPPPHNKGHDKLILGCLNDNTRARIHKKRKEMQEKALAESLQRQRQQQCDDPLQSLARLQESPRRCDSPTAKSPRHERKEQKEKLREQRDQILSFTRDVVGQTLRPASWSRNVTGGGEDGDAEGTWAPELVPLRLIVAEVWLCNDSPCWLCTCGRIQDASHSKLSDLHRQIMDDVDQAGGPYEVVLPAKRPLCDAPSKILAGHTVAGNISPH